MFVPADLRVAEFALLPVACRQTLQVQVCSRLFSKPPDLVIEGTKCDAMFPAPDTIRITTGPAVINNGQQLVVCMKKIFVFHADSLPKPKIGSESCTSSYRFEVNRSEYKSCNTEEIPLLGMVIS